MKLEIWEAEEMYNTYVRMCEICELENEMEFADYLIDLKDKGHTILD